MSVQEANQSNNVVDTEKSKIEKRLNPVQYYVKFSFSITYIFLLTTATITFIEAIRTEYPKIRHILNLETAISLIGGYFYSVFLEKISTYDKLDKVIDWADITSTRYIDWSMTTPLMLIALCLALSHKIGKDIKIEVISFIVILNILMLYLGYLGEVKSMNRYTACFFGFIAFFTMFYLIFSNFVLPKYDLGNYILFSIFTTVWTLYGVVYLLNEEYKNIAMNILDCISKCCIGLGLWAYLAKVIVL